MNKIINLTKGLILTSAVLFSASAYAIPSLQLSGDGSADWNYDTGDDTWMISGTNSFNLLAHANATKADGGNGFFAWDAAGATDRYAYLIVAATPDLGMGSTDIFDISINGGSVSMVTSGYGNPPIEDTNSISPHGIFDTYFEIYEFQFDGNIVQIKDEQPGCVVDCLGKGYTETLAIDILSLNPGIEGLHFDLFTVAGDGIYNPDLILGENKKLVKRVAPYSHDAEYVVPEPGVLLLLCIGLLGIGTRQLVPEKNP